MDYEGLIEDVDEIYNKYTIVEGYIDICKVDNYFTMKDLECFWIIIGKFDEDEVKKAFRYEDYNVEREGSYSFKAVLQFESDEDEYGRPISRGNLFIQYIKLEFYQSFESRDRERKLDNLLDNDSGDLFDDFFNQVN